MARGDSTINVAIIGDARKLITAIGAVDKATGGLVKSSAKLAIGGFVAAKGVQKGFDALGDSLQEADRRGDAIFRLTDKLGDLAGPLIATSDNFAKIGASSQDMLELEATFADLAVSAGLSAPEIAANAESMAIAALAAAQVHDADPSEVINAIGRATGGATKSIKPYGVDLSEAAVQQQALHDTGKDNPKMLTDTELAAARATLILQAFGGTVSEVTDKEGDFNQKQDELGAKFETVMGKIGAGVEGPLTDVLDFLNDEIDAIPGAIAGWQMLGAAVEGFGRTALGPLGNVRDALEGLINLLSDVGGGLSSLTGGGSFDDRDIQDALNRQTNRNNAQGRP